MSFWLDWGAERHWISRARLYVVPPLGLIRYLPESWVIGHGQKRSFNCLSSSGSTTYYVSDFFGPTSAIEVLGSRIDERRFVISGHYDLEFTQYGPENGCGCGTAEIAVVRFSGDPATLPGSVPTSAYDLVTAGLVGESDVLFVKDDFVGPYLGAVSFSYEVDVDGIADEEIYVFATAQDIPEPSGPMMLLAGAFGLYGLARLRSCRQVGAPKRYGWAGQRGSIR